MKNEIVEVRKKQIVTNSLKFAEEFELIHKNVLAKIRILKADDLALEDEFDESTFTNKRGREYPVFYMNRDGYMTLVMNMSAKGESLKILYKKKRIFIKAFNKLEEMVLTQQRNENSIEWKRAREQGKLVRRETTDIIKEFVEYAINQGSKNAKRYYGNITKMQYKALGIIQLGKPKVRDILDIMDIGQLAVAENIVQQGLKRYMEEKVHYKEIYLLCKQDVEEFGNKYCSSFIKKIGGYKNE